MTASRSTTPGRATRQGAAVDAALADADGFRTAQALYDELRSRGESVGLTTVYRHLRRGADDGSLDVVTQPDGEASYRLCGPAAGTPEASGGGHHHHVVCRECGHSVAIEGPEVERWAERVAADAGFVDITHTVEIFGLCPRHAHAPEASSGRTSTGASPA